MDTGNIVDDEFAKATEKGLDIENGGPQGRTLGLAHARR